MNIILLCTVIFGIPCARRYALAVDEVVEKKVGKQTWSFKENLILEVSSSILFWTNWLLDLFGDILMGEMAENLILYSLYSKEYTDALHRKTFQT